MLKTATLKTATLKKLSVVAVLLGSFFVATPAAETAPACAGQTSSDRTTLNLAIPQVDRIRLALNAKLAGKEMRLTKRKKLRINRITRVEIPRSQGIVLVTADVTLKRRIRSNAHGTMVFQVCVLRPRVTSIRPLRAEFVLANYKIKKVRLSHTTRVGEWFYKEIPNLLLRLVGSQKVVV